MPVDRHEITVLYGENKLHKTVSILATATVGFAKEVAAKEIMERLRSLEGVPSSISIDEECTDFYPAASDETALRDLSCRATIVMWPRAEGGYTSSPIVDALARTTGELEALKAQAGAGEGLGNKEKADEGEGEGQQKKKGKKSKKAASTAAAALALASTSTPTPSEPSSTPQTGPPPPALDDAYTLEMIMGRLSAAETKLAAVETANKVMEARLKMVETQNEDLKADNAKKDREIGELRATLQMTMNAVLGGRTATNESRYRPDRAQHRGPRASPSMQEQIAESVLCLSDDEDRRDMSLIFKAVYGVDP